jgi:nicotinamide riboside kinase
MLVVNLLGEPGVGKSVTAAGLFYELSINGFKAEVIQEVAKGYAWETPKDKDGNSFEHPIFSQQIFILGEQNRLLERVNGKRDIAIMECPLILGAIYQPSDYFKSFEALVLEQFNAYNNFNILLERSHDYDHMGRMQNETQSLEVRNKLKDFLEKHNIPYIKMKTHEKINQEILIKIRDKFFPNQKLNTIEKN